MLHVCALSYVAESSLWFRFQRTDALGPSGPAPLALAQKCFENHAVSAKQAKKRGQRGHDWKQGPSCVKLLMFRPWPRDHIWDSGLLFSSPSIRIRTSDLAFS